MRVTQDIFEVEGIFLLYTPALNEVQSIEAEVTEETLDSLGIYGDSDLVEINPCGDCFLLKISKVRKCFLPFNSRESALKFATENPALMEVNF